MGSIEEVLGEYAHVPIEPFIKELASSSELPSFAVAFCTLRYEDAGPFLRAALERAATDTLTDRQDERLSFRAMFIIGGRRDPLGFEPLLRLLRRSQDEVEYFMGDANPEHLPRIVAGMFNGDTDALFDTVMDLRLEDLTRDALLGAATFLTWEGRIDRERMTAFLRRFETDRLAPDEDLAWSGWAQAVALLGVRELAPAVLAAYERGLIESEILERHEFMESLQRAERAPKDIQPFKDAGLGYIDDVVVALEHWILGDHFVDDHLTSDDDDISDEDILEDLGMPRDPRLPLNLAGVPASNPWRHIGRNDPCSCGSGKKAKRCCLAG
jgi:hypothetical protein